MLLHVTPSEIIRDGDFRSICRTHLNRIKQSTYRQVPTRRDVHLTPGTLLTLLNHTYRTLMPKALSSQVIPLDIMEK